MKGMGKLIVAVALTGALSVADPAPAALVTFAGGDSVTAESGGCSKGSGRAREIADGRFLRRRWELDFFRDAKRRPCLTIGWSRYGRLIRFRVRDHRPRLGMLSLDATSPPRVRRTVYVVVGYVTPRVARMTFRIDGKTDTVRIVRTPRSTRLRKDLFVHFVGRGRFDRDPRGRLRAFGRNDRLLAERILRRRQFFEPAAEPQ